jgi:hypothetical protein
VQEQDLSKKVTLHKPEGTRSAARWWESAEEDFETVGFRNRKRKSQDLDQ